MFIQSHMLQGTLKTHQNTAQKRRPFFFNSPPEDLTDCYMVVGSSAAKEDFVHMMLRVRSVKVRCW